MFRRRKGEENGWADARLLLYRTSAECSEPWRAGGARYDISFFSAAAFRYIFQLQTRARIRKKRAVKGSRVQSNSVVFTRGCAILYDVMSGWEISFSWFSFPFKICRGLLSFFLLPLLGGIPAGGFHLISLVSDFQSSRIMLDFLCCGDISCGALAL